jgi:hypothetical protein
VILLEFAGITGVGLLVVAVAQLVLAIKNGRRPRGCGLAFAHAVLATAVAGVLAIAGADTMVSLLNCWAGDRCAAPSVTYMALGIGLSTLFALSVAACVPSARKGRAPRRVMWRPPAGPYWYGPPR